MRTGKQIKVPSTGGAGKFLNGSSYPHPGQPAATRREPFRQMMNARPTKRQPRVRAVLADEPYAP